MSARALRAALNLLTPGEPAHPEYVRALAELAADVDGIGDDSGREAYRARLDAATRGPASGYVVVFRSTGNAFTPGTTSRDRADMVANVDTRGIVGTDRDDVARRALAAARRVGVSSRALAIVDRAAWEVTR